MQKRKSRVIMNPKYRGLAVLDIDGVLADFEEGFCEAFGYSNRDLYSLEERYPDADQGLLKEFVENPLNYKDLAPIFGGVLLLNQLYSRGYYILLMTSRRKELKTVTFDWLKKYNIPFQELYFSCNKQEGINDFLALHGNLELQIFVDDSVSTLRAVERGAADRVPFLAWGQPWKEGYYPRLRYNESAFKVEANVGDGTWKWIWEK